jgi:hypothetical protein
VRFYIEGGTLARASQPPYNVPVPQTVVIPVWTSADEPQEVRVSAGRIPAPWFKPSAIQVEPVALVAYDPAALPVQLRAHRPYTATVRTDRPCVLETHREFVPGYEALVNGARVEPARAPNGMLTVPLRPGDNEVKLVYRGPLLARVAFVVSCLGWLAVLGFASYWCWRGAASPESPATEPRR